MVGSFTAGNSVGVLIFTVGRQDDQALNLPDFSGPICFRSAPLPGFLGLVELNEDGAVDPFCRADGCDEQILWRGVGAEASDEGRRLAGVCCRRSADCASPGPFIAGAQGPKIVFHAEDVAALRETLVGRGASFGKVREGEFCLCDGKDPDGNPIQLSSR